MLETKFISKNSYQISVFNDHNLEIGTIFGGFRDLYEVRLFRLWKDPKTGYPGLGIYLLRGFENWAIQNEAFCWTAIFAPDFGREEETRRFHERHGAKIDDVTKEMYKVLRARASRNIAYQAFPAYDLEYNTARIWPYERMLKSERTAGDT